MRINEKRILSNVEKRLDIKKSYQYLQENNTLVEQVRFENKMNTKSNEELLENSQYLLDVPATRNIISNIFESTNLSENELLDQKDKLSECTNSEDIINLIDSLVESRRDTDYIIEDTKLSLLNEMYDNAFSSTESLNESYHYVFADMDVIARNINSTPESVNMYIELLKQIEIQNPNAIAKDIPKLLVRNTDIICNCTIILTNDVLKAMTSLPRMLAYKIVDANISNSQKKRYINMIDLQINRIMKILRHGDDRQYTTCKTYLDELRDSRAIIYDNINKVNKSTTESIADMQPGVPNDVEEDKELMDEFLDEIAENLCHILYSDNYQVMIESAVNLSEIEQLIEGKVADKLVKGAVVANKGTTKVANAVTKTGSDTRRVAVATKNIVTPFARTIGDFVDNIQKTEKNKRRERVITKSFRSRASLLIRQGIKIVAGSGAAYAANSVVPIVGPIVILIGVIGSVYKTLDDEVRERNEIISELETELKITREKIEDAKGDENKEKKYQLMRIEQALEKEVNRLKFTDRSGSPSKVVYDHMKSSKDKK